MIDRTGIDLVSLLPLAVILMRGFTKRHIKPGWENSSNTADSSGEIL